MRRQHRADFLLEELELRGGWFVVREKVRRRAESARKHGGKTREAHQRTELRLHIHRRDTAFIISAGYRDDAGWARSPLRPKIRRVGVSLSSHINDDISISADVWQNRCDGRSPPFGTFYTV